jgi:dephospho-CoA kinase
MMFVIGLTGSIAMGKTTTARLFADEGVPVHDADAAVHKLYAGEAAGLIEVAFPGSTRNGTVDRVQLGKQVTGDPTALRRLEEIVHPLVRNAERKFLRDAEIAGAPIVVLDVPLLFETGGDGRVDATVVVSASAEMQRERVLERGVSLERLEALLGRQMPDAEKRRRADFVVDSGQGVEHARAQVRQILAAVAKMPTRQK